LSIDKEAKKALFSFLMGLDGKNELQKFEDL